MSCLPIVSDSCDRREQVFRVGAAAPRVFNSKYLFLLYSKADNNAVPYLIPQVCVPLMQKYYWCATQLCYYNVVHCWPD